jgi:hypothetical protein
MYRKRSHWLAGWITRLGLLALIVGLGLVMLPAKRASAGGLVIKAEPLGAGIQFHANSAFAVDWEIQVSTGSILTSPFPPHFDTGGTLPPRIKRVSTNGTGQASFAPFVGPLAPNLVYNYIVRGGSSYFTGSVRTFQSKLTVTFDRIDVIDDSDDFSAGDLTFHFNAGGGFLQEFGEVVVSSGNPVPLPTGSAAIRSVAFNRIGTLQAMVEGVDDDKDTPFEACRSGQLPDGTTGSDNCFDWATASFSSSVAAFTGSQANFTSKVVTAQTTSSRLKFKLTATITVEYAPFFTS